MKIVHQMHGTVQAGGGADPYAVPVSRDQLPDDMQADLVAVTVNEYREDEVLHFEGSAKTILEMLWQLERTIMACARVHVKEGRLDPEWLEKFPSYADPIQVEKFKWLLEQQGETNYQSVDELDARIEALGLNPPDKLPGPDSGQD